MLHFPYSSYLHSLALFFLLFSTKSTVLYIFRCVLAVASYRHRSGSGSFYWTWCSRVIQSKEANNDSAHAQFIYSNTSFNFGWKITLVNEIMMLLNTVHTKNIQHNAEKNIPQSSQRISIVCVCVCRKFFFNHFIFLFLFSIY